MIEIEDSHIASVCGGRTKSLSFSQQNQGKVIINMPGDAVISRSGAHSSDNPAAECKYGLAQQLTVTFPNGMVVQHTSCMKPP